MKTKSPMVIVFLIYVITVGIRLIFAFQSPTFSDDQSYFALRQVEHIRDTGFPLYEDPLSYGGRTHTFSPLFYYILAVFNLFMPTDLVGKIIPNILANTVIIISYLIVMEITKNQKAAIFTAASSAFIPIFFAETVNSVSPYSLVLPLMLTLIYCFLMIDKGKRYITAYIVSIVLLTFTNSSVYIIIFGFMIYILLLLLEQSQQPQAEVEVILFSLFLVFWSQFIIYRQAFIQYGSSVLLQNVPSQIIAHYFQELSIMDAINQIGIIPLLFGMYVIYRYSFTERKWPISLIVSFILLTSILLWFKLIPLKIGLIFAGIFLSLIFCQYLKLLLIYIQKSKFYHYENHIIGGIILLFILTSIVPSMYYANAKVKSSFSQEETNAMLWLHNNTPENSTVLASYKEGSFLNFQAERKNVIDTSFFLVENIDQKFENVEEIYKTNLETRAIELLNLYNVDYILISDLTRETYSIKEISYVDDTNCFKLVYEEKDVKIFKSLCSLETRK